MGRVCTKCGGGAVYSRAYSGESLCEGCFTSSIVEKVRRTLARYRMFEHGDRIAIGVSGGKDSLALLKIMSELSKEHSSEIISVTIDEGIAGYREEALRFAEGLARDLGVKHIVLSYRELYGFGLDQALSTRELQGRSCTICGILRRRALELGGRKVEADVIATAHNLDDFLQTFLMNLLRGDVERLSWLDPLHPAPEGPTIRRVKPFLEVYEREVAFYARLTGIPFQSVPCPYREGSMRSEVRNTLDTIEAGHAGAKYSLLRSALRLCRSVEVKKEEEERKLCPRCGFLTTGDLCGVCRVLDRLGNR